MKVPEYFDHLEETLMSCQKIRENQVLEFNDVDGQFKHASGSSASLAKEVEKANEYLNDQVDAIIHNATKISGFNDRVERVKKIAKELKPQEEDPIEIHTLYHYIDQDIEKLESAAQSSTRENLHEVKEHLNAENFEKISRYVQERLENLAYHASQDSPKDFWRREETGLPNAIQIEIPQKEDWSPDEIHVIIHLKSEEGMPLKGRKRKKHVVHLGSGDFKDVKLSTGYSPKSPKLVKYATATPKTKLGKYAKPKEWVKPQKSFKKEIEILKKFRGKPGIIQLIAHSFYNAKSEYPGVHQKYNIVMTHADTDLEKQLSEGSIENQQAYFLRLLEGLVEVHKEGVIHFDLKPDNIMIADGLPIIADFGLALTEDEDLKGARGTPYFFSPEMWKGMISRDYLTQVKSKTDVFSMGLVLYLIKKGNKFPLGNTLDILYENNRAREIPQKWKQWQSGRKRLVNAKIKYSKGKPALEDQEMAIILKMLEFDQNDRITAQEALDLFRLLYAEKKADTEDEAPS